MTRAVVTEAGTPKKIDAELVKLGVVVMLGLIITMVDGTLMVVAIDAITKDFTAPAQTIQWVTSAYLLANCAAIPAVGYAVNRFSGRTIWLLSLTGFLVASVLCGLAWSPISLIVFRVLQGFSGGFIGMTATIVLTRAAGPDRAGRAFSMIAVPTSLAPVLGPIISGAVVDASSWRWLFYGQIPLLAAGLIAGAIVLPKDDRDLAARLDWFGLLLIAPGLAALVYGLAEVAHAGGSGIANALSFNGLGVAAIGLALVAAFVVHGLRRRDTSLIDLRLFVHRRFNITAGLLFMVGFLLYGLLFLIPLYYQQVAGLNATSAGALLAPQGAGMGIAALFVGSLSDRFGARPMVFCGLVLTMAGTIAFAFVDGQPNDAVLAVSLAVRGLGLCAVSVPLSAALYQVDLPKEAIPHIATVSAVMMRLGGSFGGAMAAVGLQLAVMNAGGALATAFADSFWWMTCLLVVPLVLAFFLPGKQQKA